MRIRTIALLALAACETVPPVSEGLVPTEETRELVMRSRVWHAPEGGDGAPLYTLAWRDAEGALEDVGLGRPVRSAIVHRGIVYAVDAQDRLVSYDGAGEALVADEVLSAPVAGPSGLVFVRREEGRAALHSRTLNGVTELLDRSMQSLGALAISPDGAHLVAVGAPPDGVAGVHVFDLGADEVQRRCLTNCALRVGEPWEGFVPNPGSRHAYVFDGDAVAWDAEGTRAEVRFR